MTGDMHWTIHSKKDPRWNSSGISMGGLFGVAEDIDNKVKELKETLGDPPDDLESSGIKV